MVKHDHEITMHLVACLTDQNRLVQYMWRTSIVHNRWRLGDLSEGCRIVPFWKHRLVTSDSGRPELLPPPRGIVEGVTVRIHAVGQGCQVRGVTGIAIWRRRP